MVYYDAFNKHSAKDVADCFTDDAQYIHSFYGTFKGREKIADFFKNNFLKYPDLNITNINIGKIEVSGDKATVEIAHLYSWPQSEKMELVKVDGMWKIVKSNCYSI